MALKKSKVLEKADKYIRQNKLRQAIDELLKYEQANTDDVDIVNIINKIGDLFAQIGNKESALEYFQKSVAHYTREGFLTKAIAILKKMLRMDPENVRAMEQLADVYIQEGLVHDAKRQFLAIAEKYKKDGLNKRALETYKKIVDLDPDNAQSRLKLAELFISEGMQQEAVEQMISLSKTLREKGDLDMAEKLLQKTRKLNIPDPSIDINLAKVLMKKGDLKGAEQVLETASATFTRNPVIMEMLGNIKLARGDSDDALKILSQVFQMDNTRDKALLELMEAELDAGRITKAWKAAQPVLDLVIRREEFERAADILRRFTEKAEHFTPALQKLALVYEKKGDKVFQISALEKLANAYKMDGNITGAEKALRQLAQLDPLNHDYQQAVKELGSSFSAEDVQVAPVAEVEELDDLVMEDTRQRQRGRVAEAEMYIEYGLKKKAYRLLDGLLKEDPFDIKANRMFAKICMEKGEIAKASKCYLNMAESYIRKKQWEKAEKYLDRSEKILPGSSSYLRKLLDREMGREEDLDEDTFVHLEDLETSDQTKEPEVADVSESVEINATDVDGFHMIDESESVSEDLLFAQSNDEESPELLLDTEASPTDEQESPLTADMSQQAPFDTLDLAEVQEEAPLDLDEEEELELEDEDSVILESISMDGEALPNMDDVELSLTEPEVPVSSGVDIHDEIEEINFYLSQNMLSEARDMLETLALDHPGHPEVERLRREVDAAGLVSGDQKEKTAQEADEPSLEEAVQEQFLDLQAEFGADMDMFADNTELTDTQAVEQVKSVEELFQEFKKGVEEQIDQEDYETHYNLGIAYKEMGLYREAVEEFVRASHDDRRFLDCCFMIATVYEQTGEVDQAVEWLESGAKRAEQEGRDVNPLLYEAGRILEAAGQADRARTFFQRIYDRSPKFRDVAKRLGI